MKKYFEFLFNPNQNKEDGLSVFRRICKTIGIFFITSIVVLIIQGFLNYFKVKYGLKTDGNRGVNSVYYYSQGHYLFYLLGIVVAPIYEEFIFRFALGKFNPTHIRISLSLLGGYLFGIGLNQYHYSFLSFPHLLAYFIVAIIGISLFLYVLINKFWSIDFGLFWNKRFSYILYFITFLFALIHLPNFTFSGCEIFIAPLALLPHFAIGISLALVRIKHGIFYAILFHALWNGMGFIRFLL